MTVCRSGIIALIIFNEFLVTKTDIVIELLLSAKS